MSFWRDIVIDLVGKSAGFTVSVTVCLLTHSYWSIAFGTVAYPLAMAVVSYILAPYRVRLSLSAMSSFSGFLGWMSVAQIVSAISWQSDRLLLAKLISNRELGIFSAASDLATIPMMALFTPIQRPLLSAFSHHQTDTPRLIRSYRIAATAVMTIGLPLLVGASFVATPLVRLLLGAQWITAAPLLRWLALSLTPSLVSMAVAPFVMARGQTQIFARNNLIELSAKLPVLIIGVLAYGLPGVIASRFAGAMAAALCSLHAIRRLTGVPMTTQLAWFWRSIASTLIMALILLMFAYPDPVSAMLPNLIGTTLLGASVYSAALWSFWALSGSSAEGMEHLVAVELQKWLGKAAKLARPSVRNPPPAQD